ncbi:uroplakin-2 [Amia ocellicauda]|uniref:uroplakin-2 n=1 Tax=Amia ocellicauda TaxID=2972642 RepID=UPI003463BB63
MRTLRLVIFGLLLVAANADFQASVLDGSGGLLTGVFANSVVLSLPPCTLAGQDVNIEYFNVPAGNKTLLTNLFTVPLCRYKRDLISVNENNGQFVVSRTIGYQVKNLVPGIDYRFQYNVGSERSNVVEVTTRAGKDYNTIDDGLPGRSAAMLVITVLLSVAMFVLIAGMIAALFIAHRK